MWMDMVAAHDRRHGLSLANLGALQKVIWLRLDSRLKRQDWLLHVQTVSRLGSFLHTVTQGGDIFRSTKAFQRNHSKDAHKHGNISPSLRYITRQCHALAPRCHSQTRCMHA